MESMLAYAERECRIWNASIDPVLKLVLLAMNSIAGSDGEVAAGTEIQLARLTRLGVREYRSYIEHLRAAKIVQDSTENEGALVIRFENIPI